MKRQLLSPGDKVAILSPSFAAPAVAPDLHEQGMSRIRDLLGLEPVEYPTTRQLDARPADRARDLMAAYADDNIRAIFATVGGDDQIFVVPHLDASVMKNKPFFGYSDNTHLLNWLHRHGFDGFYGGSTQVHLAPGPAPHQQHLATLRAALFTGESLELQHEPRSQDFGERWESAEALTSHGSFGDAEPWEWFGGGDEVTGRTWGGCVEVLRDLLIAGRFAPTLDELAGHVILLETSEECMRAPEYARILRAMGERGVWDAAVGVMVARPPSSSHEHVPAETERRAYRDEIRDTAARMVARYNPSAVVVTGVPFGHTTPQVVLPYGGEVTLSPTSGSITAHYT